MPDATASDGFDDLPVEEQIEYVQHLWERISASPERVPIPEWHREVVRERLESHRAAPDEAVSWDSERQRIEENLRKRRP